MVFSRAIVAALAGVALAEPSYTYTSCQELKPLRKHYMNNCTVAEYCIYTLAWSGFLGNAALELANEGFYAHTFWDLIHMGRPDLAQGEFHHIHDGFVFEENDDSFIGNSEFANDGFVANLAWSNTGFFAGFSNYEYFDANGGYFDDVAACSYMMQCHEFEPEGAFGTCNSAYQLGDEVAPIILTGDCQPSWIGDGVCDLVCNVPRFMNDRGDCAPSNCKTEFLGDQNCNPECNWPEHNYDGGDCLPSGCQQEWLGDGECDAVCDNASLHHDGGDCPSGDQLSITFEEELVCNDAWLGDGQCDPICNKEEFGFDNGDCLAFKIFADSN